ncbi:facilitated trehalose transporter Tret1-like isoform X2 [Bradysia coprophila]|nr:facilitated trehalose transporter Tret1-like isoform X2 [Bradysia coprophila]
MEAVPEKGHQNARRITQYIAALIAMGGALSAGAVFGWSSPAQVRLTNQTEYGFPINDEEWSWVGSTITLGAAFSCAIIGTIITFFGRKNTMLGLVVPFTVGWALVCWANSVAMLLVGRILLGISGGAFFVVAPMYIGEIAEKEIRGALGSFFQLMVTTGILFVYAVGYDLNVFTFSIICGVLPLAFAAAFVFMPESPLYLVSKNRSEDAIKSLKWLRGEHYDYNHELNELQSQHEADINNRISILTALKRRATVKALIIIVGLMFFLQLSGINIVIFYTGFIFDAAHIDIKTELATILIGIMQVVATFVASMIVDKTGRRVLLLISISVMAISKILLGVYFYLYSEDPASVENLGWLPVFALCLYIIVFSLGFGPIPWLMVGELFASDIKGIGGSAAGAFSWIFAFVVTKTFSNIQTAIGIGPTFFLLSGFSILGTVFVFFVVPETKGKSLAEIQTMLGGTGNSSSSDEDTDVTVSVNDER